MLARSKSTLAIKTHDLPFIKIGFYLPVETTGSDPHVL